MSELGLSWAAWLAVLGWALGWALVHGLWQGALIAATVRAALVWTEQPRLRFAWAWGGMLAIALCFVATARYELLELLAQLRAAAGTEPSPQTTAALGRGAQLIDRALLSLVLVWACGLLFTGTRAAVGFAGVARLRARARALDPSLALDALTARLAQRIGVAAPVEVRSSDAIETPLVLGWLRPLILLPAGLLAGLDRVALEAAIAHELAHVRRSDYLLNAISLVIEALMFHHPCVWWLASVARREREHACDDLVVARAVERSAYARSLLALEQLRSSLDPSPKPAPSMAADGAPLLARIRRLLDTPTDPGSAMNHHDIVTRTDPTIVSKLRLASWAPLLLTTLGLGLALGLPACLGPDETASEDPREAPAVEGTISTDDDPAAVSLRWLPDPVVAHVTRIEAAARRHGVDPDLLAVLVLVESGGNARAESPTGARGLMQLMPQTAAHIASERALRDHDLDRLWDPDYNLDLGAWHLARLLERWGEIELAVAAYNGGTKAVERWTAGEGELSDETAAYKARVVELWTARDEAELPR